MNRSYHPPRRKGSSQAGPQFTSVDPTDAPRRLRSCPSWLSSRLTTVVTWAVPVCVVIGGSIANAQFTLPPDRPGTSKPAPASSQLAPSAGQPVPSAGQPSMSISGMLQQIDSAIAASDYTTAVQTFRTAGSLLSSGQISNASQAGMELMKRRERLIAAGIDAVHLSPPSNTSSKNTHSGNAAPVSASAVSAASPLPARQSETRRLTAMGRAALDRGDVRSAYALATQAQSLNVAQDEFAPGEARPWQLLLDVQATARRSGTNLGSIAQVGGDIANDQSGSGSMITQAGGSTPFGYGSPSENQFIQMVQATALIDGDEPDSDSDESGPGETLYREGMQMLSAGKQVEAREKFVQAWKYESDLPTDIRRALQDKLTLLQPMRMPTASTPDKPMTPIQKADLAAASAVKRLYREVTTELAEANGKKESAPLDAQDDLERLARKIQGANIDEASRASLGAMVGRALSEQTAYVEANRAKIQLDLNNDAVRSEMEVDAAREAKIDDEISSLVESFNDLMNENRFQEAEVIAKQVAELKPNSPIATSLAFSSRMQSRIQMDEEIKAGSEDGFARQMLAVGAAAIAPDPDRPFSFQDPQTWEDLSRRRLSAGDKNSRLTVREQEIKRKLENDVELKYRDRPLGEVLDELSAVTGVPIAIDSRALAAVRVTRDTPVSKSITNRISLQSALNLLLEDLGLTYVLKNDVLNITSREARRTMVETKVYRVADLVTPIPNFISGYEHGLAGALASAYQMINPKNDVQLVPVSATDLGGGFAGAGSNNQLGRNMLGQYNPMGNGGGLAGALGPAGALASGRGGGSMADFGSLMMLVQQTIEPDTWEALGGVGTMAPYPQNLSLVISTTSDVHDQIVDLLESLRRLQNLQITIEVRFITLADTFFEQIGIDFDVRFDDNVGKIPNDDSGPSVTIGLDAPGIPTGDLDIRLDQNTFGAAAPVFGAPDPGALSTIGFAILSDIEAFFFLQAAQGDTRSNIMQAPKVTLFDGQIASINDTVSRPFVTSIIPVVGDFAVAQQPVIVVLDEGTRLNVQGVVSDDKRFVRLTLVPTFSQIGQVNTFTYEGSRTSRSNSTTRNEDTNGDGVIDQKDEREDAQEEITQGTTVQQPTFAQTSVSTTVSVPDGGTILLGGIKRMSEGRTERGVPFLSKIPYVSRLFRNSGIGRTSTSLMLMVTPRIIIQEEEEMAQTGFDPTR